MMTTDYEDVAAAFSPASSVASSASAMSLSADASPVPSPAESTTSECSSSSSGSSSSSSSVAHAQPQKFRECLLQSQLNSGKRKHAWEEGGAAAAAALDNDKRRRVAVAAAAASSSSAMPKPTHKPEYNEQLQGQFEAAVERGSREELDRLLSDHSEKIDVDRYGRDGRTPLQAVVGGGGAGAGGLALAKLLVAYGADATRTTREGWSTLHLASYSGNLELLSYIRKCCSVRRR